MIAMPITSGATHSAIHHLSFRCSKLSLTPPISTQVPSNSTIGFLSLTKVKEFPQNTDPR
jgi:hypothetical protein